MKHDPQLQKMKKNEEAMRYQFISTELDLALTFAEIARSSDDENRAQRNLDRSKKAYQAARTYLEQGTFTAEMKTEIQRKLSRLERFFNNRACASGASSAG